MNIHTFPYFQNCYIGYMLLFNQIFKTQLTLKLSVVLKGKVDYLKIRIYPQTFDSSEHPLSSWGRCICNKIGGADKGV